MESRKQAITMQRRIKAALGGAAAVAAVALALGGCSTSGGSSGGSTSGGNSPLTYMNMSDQSCSVPPNPGVDFDSAKALIQTFQTPAKSIPITTPLTLTKPINSSVTVEYADNGTPVGDGLWLPYIQDAVKTAGATFEKALVGSAPADLQAGFNAIVQNPPTILILGAIDVTQVADQIAQLQKEGVILVDGSDPNATKLNLPDSLGGYASQLVNGEVLAAGAVYFTCGTADNFVFFNIPELGFSAIDWQAFQDEMKKLEPNATLSTFDISIATTDATPAVQYLQAHPEVQFFATPGDQFQIGIADAAKTAGITNAYGFGQSSLAQNLTQIQSGQEVAGFVESWQSFMYTLLDEGLRYYEGMSNAYPGADDSAGWTTLNANVASVATQKNYSSLNFDSTGNFIAYKNTPQDFATIWSGKSL